MFAQPQRPALDLVLPHLRCPVCAGTLVHAGAALGCAAGHSFDVARQGYVNFAAGARGPRTGDTAAMVAAREQFLGAEHYAPIAARVAAAVGAHAPGGLVVDLAGGTGYYLRPVLDAAADRLGVCVDLSAPALRRAARAHPRAAAVGADTWQPLPFAPSCAAAVLSIFGPRNVAEIARLLAPGGVLVVVSPRPQHLRELVRPLGLVSIDPDKDEREAAAFGRFGTHADDRVSYSLTLGHADAVAAVAMGPSAAHIAPADLVDAVRPLPDPMSVTVAVRVAVYAGCAEGGVSPTSKSGPSPDD